MVDSEAASVSGSDNGMSGAFRGSTVGRVREGRARGIGLGGRRGDDDNAGVSWSVAKAGSDDVEMYEPALEVDVVNKDEHPMMATWGVAVAAFPPSESASLVFVLTG